jgi:hypothetical protein
MDDNGIASNPTPRLMTNEKMRVKIAELMGWKACRRDLGLAERICTRPSDGFVGISPIVQKMEHGGDESKDFNYWLLPNYPESLDACHEMEKGLETEDHRFAYTAKLCTLTKEHPPEARGLWRIAHATAAQRCIAFLAVHGAWEETPA